MDIVNICSVQSAQAMCNMRTIVWKLSITLAPMLYRKNLHSILWYPTTIIREKTFFIESVRVWYEKYKQNYKVVITYGCDDFRFWKRFECELVSRKDLGLIFSIRWAETIRFKFKRFHWKISKISANWLFPSKDILFKYTNVSNSQ